MRLPPTINRQRLADVLHDAPPVLPALALTTFWALSALFYGAYFPSAWYPAAIIVVLIVPLQLAAGCRLPVGGTRLALALLGGFIAWTALSIAWAEAGGHALEATNELLLAAASAFVFALTAWNERRATWVAGSFAIGLAIATVTTLLLAAFGSEPANSFSEARFAEPLGYAGGSAAYAAMAVWPALALATRGRWPTWLRGAMFAIAAVQADLAFLPQARGAAVGLVLSIPFFVFFSSSRAWSTTRVLVLAVAVALSVGPILDVSTAANNGTSIAASLQDAALGIAITAAITFLVGLLLAQGEARRPVYPGSAAARRYRRPILVAGAIVLAIAVALSWSKASSEISQRWSDFKTGRTSSESSGHLTQLGDPERYDYWRVAVKVTGESPLNGNGAGNFQDAYTIDRHEEKHSKYAHEIWLRFSSETGIVGVLLFVGFFLAAFIGVALRRRRMSSGEQLLTAGLLAATAYFLLHASVDWIDEFPALLGPALAFPLLAGRLAEPTPSGPPRRQAVGLFAGLVVAGLALAALVPAYLSLRFLERAKSEAPTNARAAYSDLGRAAYLNPLSAEADVTYGRIALFRGEYREAQRAFERAIDREEDWYPHFVLAAIASHEGERRQAIAQMEAALALDPVDDGVREALAHLRRGAVIDPIEAQEQLESESRERFFRLHPSEAE